MITETKLSLLKAKWEEKFFNINTVSIKHSGDIKHRISMKMPKSKTEGYRTIIINNIKDILQEIVNDLLGLYTGYTSMLDQSLMEILQEENRELQEEVRELKLENRYLIELNMNSSQINGIVGGVFYGDVYQNTEKDEERIDL